MATEIIGLTGCGAWLARHLFGVLGYGLVPKYRDGKASSPKAGLDSCSNKRLRLRFQKRRINAAVLFATPE